jgi:uncharacterized protein (DUF697 family)
MNKKKLPKAIRLPDDSGAVSGVLELPEPSSLKAHESAEIPATNGHADTVANESAELDPGPEEKASSRALTRVAASGSRRRLAEAVVERHANYSALGGVIPLPIVNFGVVTAIIVRMVKALTDIYGIPFEHDRARAIVLGLIGGLAPTAASTLTASTLFYLVPGSNILGLAVSSVTASACTRKIGAVFVEHFEKGATLADFPAATGDASL